MNKTKWKQHAHWIHLFIAFYLLTIIAEPSQWLSTTYHLVYVVAMIFYLIYAFAWILSKFE